MTEHWRCCQKWEIPQWTFWIMGIYYFWINEIMETDMLIFTYIDKIILTYQANSLWLMIANNVIYLNMPQNFSFIYIPTGLLARNLSTTKFPCGISMVSLLCANSPGAGIVSVWQRQQRVLLAPCLTHSTVTASPRLWVKTREKNFLSFLISKTVKFPPSSSFPLSQDY